MTPAPSGEVAALSPARAAADREALRQEHFDVLVIGGGVVGAGVALDAASRGLSVALVEAADFAAGTSSRSSKLIHGGLRYIQTHEFALVREALRERALLHRLAPHLVRPAAFLYPLRHRIERPYVAAGVGLYDLFARVPGAELAFPRARHLSAPAARRSAPALRPERCRGAVIYADAQVDDARFVVAVLRSAAGLGARVVSRARVVGFLGDRQEVRGARVQLLDEDKEIEVRARVTVSATGAWSEQLEALAGGGGLALRPSKGVHLVVPRDAIDASLAMIIPTRRSVLFVLPWGAHWIVGTTDTPWDLGPDLPVASRSDIDYLLEQLNAVLARPVGRGAVESVYVGLRPLLRTGSGATTKLSREHGVAVPRPGLAVVAGGKYTTYRVMAKDALDAALESAGVAAPRARTEDFAIAGAAGFAECSARAESAAAAHGLSVEEYDRLLSRYGGLIDEVLGNPPRAPEARVVGYLERELAYAVTHEGARHLDDVLARRTRIRIEAPDRGVDAAATAASIVAPLLGWSEATSAEEVAAYRARVGAELRGETFEDDASAQQAVLDALDAPVV